MSDYDELMDMSWDELPEEVLLPEGEWLLSPRYMAFFKAREEGKSHRVILVFSPVEPMDVDEGDLAELPDDYDPSMNEVEFQVWIDGPRGWNDLRQTLERIGVETSGSLLENGKIAKSMQAAFRAASAVGRLEVESFERNDGTVVTVNRVKRLAAVEDE